MNARNIHFRYDEKLAEGVLSNIVSSKKALRILAGMILDICESANGLNPLGWEVTLEKDSICVNVGRIALMIVGNKYGVDAKDVHFYCGSVNPDLKRRFRGRLKTHKELYQSVPVPGAVLPLRISEVAKLTNREISMITASQLKLVEESWERRQGRCLWHRSHSPAVIECFNRLCSRDVPQPQYIIGPHPPMRVKDLIANKAVEKAAIDFVMNYYRTRGYEVKSVELDKIGYDLECIKNRSRLHIEVKGRSNGETRVILTSGEYQAALDDSNWRLVIVTDPQSKTPKRESFRPHEMSETFILDPVAYRLIPRE